MEERMSDTTRRTVLAGAAGLTAVTVLAACGDDEPTDTPGATTPTTGGGAPPTGGPAAANGALAKKADIPVGGGKIFTEGGGVVITQPTAGEFKAFSATCTHQSCTVASVANGDINCACHGSKFSAADGSVKNGPAARPLAAKELKIEGDDISLA
jgi:Rieske Fe-S protein